MTVAVRAVVNGQASLSIPGYPGFVSYAWGKPDATPPNPSLLQGPRETPKSAAPAPFPFGGPQSFPGTTPADGGMSDSPRSRLRNVSHVPNAPPLTHATVRHRLMTPRAKLYIFSGPGMESGVPRVGTAERPGRNRARTANKKPVANERVQPETVMIDVESPFGREVCDCKNGPTPKIMGVYAVEGDASTFLVDWSCETYINEAEDNAVKPTGPLLSNRFSQTHTIDQYGFTTFLTRGTAIFRTDVLFKDGDEELNPDVLRPVLFMPIMQGFVRENIVVTGLPDATGVSYEFQDRQVEVNFVAAPYARAASIAAVHTQEITTAADIAAIPARIYTGYKNLKATKNFADMTKDAEEARVKSVDKELRSLRRAVRKLRKDSKGP